MLNERIHLTKAFWDGLVGIVVAAENAEVTQTIAGSFHGELTARGGRRGHCSRRTDKRVVTNCQVEDAVRPNDSESEPMDKGVARREGSSVEVTF